MAKLEEDLATHGKKILELNKIRFLGCKIRTMRWVSKPKH